MICCSGMSASVIAVRQTEPAALSPAETASHTIAPHMGSARARWSGVVCPACAKVHGRILAWLASASDHSLSNYDPMQHLTLYSTSHCSLCEQALICCLARPGWRVCSCRWLTWPMMMTLLERYGEKIPVLRLGDRELHAPFGAEELARFHTRLTCQV